MTKEHILSERVAFLLKLAKFRNVPEVKIIHEEKTISEFVPFKIVSEVESIEEALWKWNNWSKIYVYASHRDRIKLGIILGESVFKH